MKQTLVLGLLGWMAVTPLAAQTCNPNIPEETPNSRFVVHGDGTVTDSRTGLMWKRCPEGQGGSDCAILNASGYPEYLPWNQALQRAADAIFAGYSDWRLPNIKELASLVETKCYAPAINLRIFPNTRSEWFWSSSAYAYYSDGAWILYFGNGNGVIGNRGYYGSVRLVRGGQ